MGQSPEGSSINKNSGLEFHQGKIYFSDVYLSPSGVYTSKATKISSPYSLLLCVRAPVGICNITEREICLGRGLCALRPYYNIDPLFWFYFLTPYRQYFDKKSTGSTFKAISQEIIADTLIPFPPQSEQKRILESIKTLFEKLS